MSRSKLDTHSSRFADENDPPALSQKLDLMYQTTSRLLSEIQSLNLSEHLDISEGIDLMKEVRNFEIKLIRQALECTDGNQKAAAALLKIKPTTLSYKVNQYRIRIKRIH